MTENRMTWQTLDHAMMRWSAVMAVAAVVAAVLAAYRFVQTAFFEGVAACVLLLVLVITWWSVNRLQKAKVVIDSLGIRREGRGGFAYTWDAIRMVGIGEGLMAGDAPYLVIATTKRRSHTSGLAAAGSGFRKPSAAVPVDGALVNQVQDLLVAKDVFRTADQWTSEV